MGLLAPCCIPNFSEGLIEGSGNPIFMALVHCDLCICTWPVCWPNLNIAGAYAKGICSK